MTDTRTPDEIDHDVREALAQALKERKTRLNDRRLLIIFLFMVAFLISLGYVVQRLSLVVDQVTKGCRDTQANAQTINMFLDKQITAYATSPVLSPNERKARAAMFTGLKQKVPTCPPGGRS